MKILIVGSGGREHALAWKIAQSKNVKEIFVAPGNGGTSQIAKNIPIKESESDKLLSFAKENAIDLVVVGPEAPLSNGLVDMLEKAHIPAFGPSKACAKLEYSKAFAKEIMQIANVPTAQSETFTDLQSAIEYADKKGAPLVVKADGLAAGKGVIICHTHDEITDALKAMFSGAFGDAGKKVVLEDYLLGEEASLFCLCDGTHAIPFPSAQDHKTIGEGDVGLNTGGMGAYSPAPVLPDSELERITDIVARPILKEMAERGTPFKGLLYAGLMIDHNRVNVIEYNVRFGDPECQPLLMRLESDLVELLMASAKGQLADKKLLFSPKTALGVVIASKGYPEDYPKGMKITGIDKAESEDVKVFHAGTKEENKEIISSGGRVMCVTALNDDLASAQEKAYNALQNIQMENSYYRKDIGFKGIDR